MTDEKKSPEDDILSLAKKRFARCLEHQSRNRVKAKDDIRFAAASPDDPYQWNEQDRKDRESTRRPVLTVNKIPQHIRQVTNDIRQNRPMIRFRPADDKADPDVADILMGVVKHIEANSDADIAYDTAAEHQVTHGLGYIRVLTDYVRDDSFDQDIFIKRVKHPFRIYLDPDIEDPAGADAMFGFVEEQLEEDEFKAQFPDQDPIDWNFVGADSEMVGWFTQDKKVRVCEYFYISDTKDVLLSWDDGSTSWKSEPAPKGKMPALGKDGKPKTRKGMKRSVQWCKMTGSNIIEQKRFPGRYVPIARVVGNEWEVDGETITSGIVRNAKDSQRMYNVGQSAVVERIMQAPKAPWAAPAAAIEGYEGIWQTANTANHSFLPYNHIDEQGNPVPAPTRVQGATVETGLNQIVMSASDDIKAETGQYDASLGQKSNETSGKAILARQREGDTSTYHYVDNLARAVRHVGRIILSMFPEVYDTPRVARIVGEDDKETQSANLDPEQQEPLIEQQDETGAIKRLFNPFIGTYDVYATTGPSFTTRRVEAAQAMTDLTQANPALWGVIGDQLVKNMDWPGAEEMAERLKTTLIPPVQQMLQQKEGGGATLPPEVQQQLQQGQQQIQELSQALENAHTEVTQMEQHAKSKAQVEQFKAQALDAREQAKHQREVQFEQVKAMQTLEDNNAKERMLDKQLATQRYIAELNAKVALAGQLANAQTAEQALQADQVLEGTRIVADLHKQEKQITSDHEMASNAADMAQQAAKADNATE